MPNNFVFAIDCSYSMVADLPNLRKDLKNKIATVGRASDIINIIYFSGNRQYGSVVEGFTLEDVMSLAALDDAIDNWLKPIGATAFEGPLKKAKERTIAAPEGYTNILMFLTDGYNNDSLVSNVLKEAEGLSEVFDFVFFVEYGMYCDSKFIQKLTEVSSGVGLNATSFTQLSEIFNRTLSNTFVPKLKVMVQTKGAERVYILTDDGDLYQYPALKEVPLISIEIPQNTLISPCSDIDCGDTDSKLVCVLAALKRGDATRVEELLLEVNSNELYQEWYNCYGKDKLIVFYNTVKYSILSQSWKISTPIVANTSNISVYQVLVELSKLEAKVKVPDYKRTTAGRDTDVLTSEQSIHMATLKSKKEIDDYIESLKPLTFVNTSGDYISLSNLVFNTERANVSMLIRRDGYVELPKNQWATNYRTHTYRNYTIIKDGILNIPNILINPDSDVYDYLKESGLLEFCSQTDESDVISLNLENLPVILRSDIAGVTAQEVAELSFELEKHKAVLKALKYYNKELNPKTQESDPEFNEFLKKYGITYNGFNPSAGKAESEDFYMAPSLIIKLKGLSSLPSVESVLKKVSDGKSLTLGDTLVKKGIDLATQSTDVSNSILDAITVDVTKMKRVLELKLAKMVFSLILSKGWFPDKKGFDDNVVELPETSCTFELKEVEIKL